MSAIGINLSNNSALQSAASFLRRSMTRRIREPSLRAHTRAAQSSEGGRVIIMDILWNLMFVAAAAVGLIVSSGELPKLPLRLWVVGYVIQCMIQVVCVCVENWERGRRGMSFLREVALREFHREVNWREEEDKSIAKQLEYANTMFSLMWWIMGLYWVANGSQNLTHDAPRLYWLCVAFLAFDMFFVLFCIFLACIIGLFVCCCLPCIVAILYAVAPQKGASAEDIRQLPKYIFRKMEDPEIPTVEIWGTCCGIMTECGTDPPIEHVLRLEDAKCCICISHYGDGVELRGLPCSHHFHLTCIDEWLYTNATCPLCKYDIIKRSNHVTEV